MLLTYRKVEIGSLLMKRIFRNRAKIIHFCSVAASSNASHETRPKCKVGDKAVSLKRISMDDVIQFAKLSGDINPIHLPSSEPGELAIVHGAFLNGLVSGLIGTKLPGAGALVVSQNLHFPKKCYAGEEVSVNVEVIEVRKIITLKFDCTVDKCLKSNSPKVVLRGETRVIIR